MPLNLQDLDKPARKIISIKTEDELDDAELDDLMDEHVKPSLDPGLRPDQVAHVLAELRGRFRSASSPDVTLLELVTVARRGAAKWKPTVT